MMLIKKPVEKIVVGVCTRRRPLLLTQCLDSIIPLPAHPDYSFDIMVIENDEAPRSESIVISARARSPHTIHYHHEPVLGIPFARNRFLEEALLLSADWLAFIDDDETAEPDWLNELFHTVQSLEADVIQGRVVYHYPPEDKWATLLATNEKQNSRPHSKARKTASTNNVIFTSSLVSSSGLGMRFDTGLVFSGGSDSDFFNRAFQQGAKIHYSAQAVVHETVPLERCTLAYLFERSARTRAAAFYMDKKNLGRSDALRKHTRRFLQSLLQAIGYLLRALFWLLPNAKKSRELYLRGVLKIANCYGGVLGLCGKLLSPYKKIQGY